MQPRGFLFNTVSIALSQGWGLILALVIAPLTIHGLGEAGFGLLSVSQTALLFMTCAEAPLTMATIRALSLAGDGSPAVLRSARTAFILLCGAESLLLLLCSHILPGLLGLSVVNTLELKHILIIYAAGTCLASPFLAYGAVPDALRRRDLTTRIDLILNTALAGIQATLLLRGCNIAVFAATRPAAALVRGLLLRRAALGALPPTPRTSSPPPLRPLLKLTGWFSVNNLASLVIGQLDRLLIACFLPLSQVTVLSAPGNLLQRLDLIRVPVLQAYLPFASAPEKTSAPLSQAFYKASHLVTVLMVPITLALALFADPLMTFWLGADLGGRSAPILRVMALSSLMGSFAWIAVSTLDALGRPKANTAFVALNAVLSVGANLLLIPRLGPMGAALALLFSTVVTLILYLASVGRRVLAIPFAETYRRCVRAPIFAGILSALIAMPASATLPSSPGWQAAAGLGMLTVYAALLLTLERLWPA